MNIAKNLPSSWLSKNYTDLLAIIRNECRQGNFLGCVFVEYMLWRNSLNWGECRISDVYSHTISLLILKMSDANALIS